MTNTIIRITAAAFVVAASLSVSHLSPGKSVRHTHGAFQVASTTSHPDQADAIHGYPI